jgi:fructoselysine/glucoselysine PTS system EIIA component
MVRFLVATHGLLADGFKSTMSVLMGEEVANKIETINAYVGDDNSSPKELLDSYIKKIENDELIIFTDVMFGSVNQFATPYAKQKNVFVITGVNFPLMLEILSKYSFDSDAKVDEDYIKDVVEKAKEQILYVNDTLNEEEKTNKEDDFFD